MRMRTIEIWVGFFVVAAMVALLALAFKVSGLTSYVNEQTYRVIASFDNIGDLKLRAPVTMAGVRIGQVSNIKLDRETFKAIVTMNINIAQNNIPTDTSASILTQGLLGSNYISFTPGFDNTYLRDGDKIENTHQALILENLIGQLLYSMTESKKEG